MYIFGQNQYTLDTSMCFACYCRGQLSSERFEGFEGFKEKIRPGIAQLSSEALFLFYFNISYLLACVLSGHYFYFTLVFLSFVLQCVCVRNHGCLCSAVRCREKILHLDFGLVIEIISFIFRCRTFLL